MFSISAVRYIIVTSNILLSFLLQGVLCLCFGLITVLYTSVPEKIQDLYSDLLLCVYNFK